MHRPTGCQQRASSTRLEDKWKGVRRNPNRGLLEKLSNPTITVGSHPTRIAARDHRNHSRSGWVLSRRRRVSYCRETTALGPRPHRRCWWSSFRNDAVEGSRRLSSDLTRSDIFTNPFRELEQIPFGIERDDEVIVSPMNRGLRVSGEIRFRRLKMG
ncbi:hypothetical protein L1987_77417 [Smallanthus sonchifolius]|uniref:Uncharacterized protein n=1 Tax=Smallanthus sonchifolius TaxID=185202 RepID=A0ACB8ZA41_9ASTR|nr:hypothetical protein L1987_77417 [Smallanthus sonchifolius]